MSYFFGVCRFREKKKQELLDALLASESRKKYGVQCKRFVVQSSSDDCGELKDKRPSFIPVPFRVVLLTICSSVVCGYKSAKSPSTVLDVLMISPKPLHLDFQRKIMLVSIDINLQPVRYNAIGFPLKLKARAMKP